MKYMRLRIPNEKTKLMHNKKDMDIKTLALYLGCKMKMIYVNEHVKNHFAKVGDIVTLDATTLYILDSEDVINAKLLLRPLSSMMEEEAVNFYDELFPFVNDAMSGKQKHSIIRNELTVDALTGYREPSQFIQYVKWFPLLLSKGFDLFGLIEKGDALDATKVEKVNEI